MLKISAKYILENGENEPCEITLHEKQMVCERGSAWLLEAFNLNTNKFSENIFRIRVINLIPVLNWITAYINYHIFIFAAQEYKSLREYCENNSVVIIEPGNYYWEKINEKASKITDYSITNNFIDEIEKKYFFKPEYYYKIRIDYSENKVCHQMITLTKKKETLVNEDVCYFKLLFSRFVTIMSKEFDIKKEYSLECVWLILENGLSLKFADQWIMEYNNGSHLKAYNLESAIDEALILGGLGKRKDNKYAMFIYYCIYNNLLTFKNFYDAWFEIEEPIRQRIEFQETELLEKKIKRNIFKRKQIRYSIDDVDLMNGHEFEQFVCDLYVKMKYDARITKRSGDQGIDVVAEKNGKRIGIQVKCYSNTVGNSAIQEAVAGKAFYHCDKIVVVTNNYFTSSAIELAQANNVILWNRDILKEKIKELM